MQIHTKIAEMSEGWMVRDTRNKANLTRQTVKGVKKKTTTTNLLSQLPFILPLGQT
jgi:hypothetical protein